MRLTNKSLDINTLEQMHEALDARWHAGCSRKEITRPTPASTLARMHHRFLPHLLGLGLAAASLVSAHATPYVVDAKSNSSSGGSGAATISLTAGQAFCISVDPNDLWSAGALPRWSNADGLVGNLYATGSDESGQAAGTLIGQSFGLWTQHGLSAPYGALVGEVGGIYFLLGTSFSGVAPASGTLNLLYWDSNNGDNTQNVTANLRVDVTCVPDGGSLLGMMGGALGVLGLIRSRRA